MRRLDEAARTARTCVDEKVRAELSGDVERGRACPSLAAFKDEPSRGHSWIGHGGRGVRQTFVRGCFGPFLPIQINHVFKGLVVHSCLAMSAAVRENPAQVDG